MARKFDLISQLYEDTSKEVMSPDKWAAFLKTACYNYRLRFDEQLLYTLRNPMQPPFCLLNSGTGLSVAG